MEREGKGRLTVKAGVPKRMSVAAILCTYAAEPAVSRRMCRLLLVLHSSQFTESRRGPRATHPRRTIARARGRVLGLLVQSSSPAAGEHTS
jgi:hypothetical protein